MLVNGVWPRKTESYQNKDKQSRFIRQSSSFRHWVSADDRPYLLGEAITECDIRAFVTGVRFNVAYQSLFKCNQKRMSDDSYLAAYLERFYNLDGISETVNIEHIKSGYYSAAALNPRLIAPIGPSLNFIEKESE
ncbi:MAG: hypothetical protein MJK10_17675 [Pseudomonadales bacterium]|nr:hypothetical protein [Pseudomonadales bacterium]NRA17964.1 hypothetical protein [Oceanospirillaceae bacterium]